MKLHFLGTTGYHPNNQRQTACLMLPELGVVLDAGTGMFRARDLIQTSTLDIFLSHLHLDHSIGLTFLYDVLYEKNLERVTVHVATDKIESVSRHLFAKDLFPVQPNFEIAALVPGDVFQLSHPPDHVSLRTIPVEHPGGCLAFRIDGLPGGRSLAYVTDTMADLSAPYVKEITGVDTLIHECYFPDGWEDRAKLTGHSCLTPVARIAKSAQVGCCYLIHVSPLIECEPPLDLESVRKLFPNMQVAADQQIIEV